MTLEKNFSNKVLTTKEKTNKFDYINIKNICFSKETFEKTKTQTTNEESRRCLQEWYLTKSYNPEYLKISYQSISKTQLTW